MRTLLITLALLIPILNTSATIYIKPAKLKIDFSDVKNIITHQRCDKFEPASYIAPDGQWTIGYGFVYNIKPNQIISKEKADSLLQIQMLDIYNHIRKQYPNLTTHQAKCMVSFFHNVGKYYFNNKKHYSLHKALISGNNSDIINSLRKYNKCNGKVLKGLQFRRQLEINLLNKYA